jgi:hypothetical protein
MNSKKDWNTPKIKVLAVKSSTLSGNGAKIENAGAQANRRVS